MDQEIKLSVSSSPHIRSAEDTRSVMLDVIIALLPALAVAMYMFGIRAMVLTLTTVAASVFFEWAYRKLLKKPCAIGDLSAIVTGMLLSFCLPVTAPIWITVAGAFFAVVIVKQLFGGIGKNFMNPALAGRAFLFSWPAIMSTWLMPLSNKSFFTFSMADAVTAATPMSALSRGVLPEANTLFQAFTGQVGGSMGEISVFALVLGGLYLIVRKIITPRVPLTYIITVAVLTFIFPRGGLDRISWMLWNLFGGGLMLGAIFMATDYTTSPVTPKGQYIFAFGCGALTVFIRYFGAYPEGVSYAILCMNACVWLIDKAGVPRRFGLTKEMRLQEKQAKKGGSAR